jgi:hypothetical protein
MEYTNGIITIFPAGSLKLNKHKEIATKYKDWILHHPEKIQNMYEQTKQHHAKTPEQFEFLLGQFCSEDVMQELDDILQNKYPADECRTLELKNGTTIIYAVGRADYLLSWATIFGLVGKCTKVGC